MAKRGAMSLTGGTGDVNPQWVAFTAVQTGNDVFLQQTFDLPTNPSMPVRSNKAMVLEFLRVQFLWSLDTTQSPATPQRHSAVLSTATVDIGAGLSTIQSSVNAITTDQFLTFQAGAGATVFTRDVAKVYDLTDGAGHGVIIASKSINLIISTFNTATSNRVVVRILYRYKEVTITEFITLAQFQS